MTYAPRWRGALVLGLLFSSLCSGCISKGGTQITTNNGPDKDDDQELDSGSPGLGDTDDEVTSDDSAQPSDSSTSSNASDASAGFEPDDTPTDDSDETTAPDDVVSDDPTVDDPTGDETGSEDTGSDDPATDTTSDDSSNDDTVSNEADDGPEMDAGAPAPQVMTEVCAVGGKPVLGKAELLSKNDLNDKKTFNVAVGPDEHLISWIDTASKELVYIVLDEDGASNRDSLAIEGGPDVIQPYVAAVYSPDAAEGAGAYAVTWKEGATGIGSAENPIAFNWMTRAGWVSEEPERYGAGMTVPYVSADGIGIAFDGTHYAIVPLAQHPYTIIVSETGSGTVLSSAETHFTRREATDVIVTDGKFMTVGRYNDGSNGTLWETLSTFDAEASTAQAANVDPERLPLFDGLAPSSQGQPLGLQMAWDGATASVLYGDPANPGLHYARLRANGEVFSNETVVERTLTPLDVYFDAESSIVYGLSTDGIDVYLIGIDPADSSVVIPNKIVASGEDVSAGFLVWDETAKRHRAYYSSIEGASHQIYSTLIGCVSIE